MSWAVAATKAKVIKAALAMANNRDGGVLVFGLEQRSGEDSHVIIGMSEQDWQSFTQDGVAAKVNAHALSVTRPSDAYHAALITAPEALSLCRGDVASYSSHVL